jgi:hypothetical protein
MAHWKQALRRRDSAAGSLGAFAGNTVFGRAVSDNTDALHRLERKYDQQSHQMERLDA